MRNLKVAAACLALAVPAFAAAPKSKSKSKRGLVALTPLSPAEKIPCPKGPACDSFRGLVASGDANVAAATWACFYEGAPNVDVGEDAPPAGRVKEDRFQLYSYTRPANADDMTHGEVYSQLVRYGKTDDSDHIGALNNKYPGDLAQAVQDTAHVVPKNGFFNSYDDSPARLLTVGIQYTGAIPAPYAGWEMKLDKTTGRFAEKQMDFTAKTDTKHFHGKCLRLK